LEEWNDGKKVTNFGLTPLGLRFTIHD